MSKNTQKGFTLIELLVVIAIIAILAAILFPVYTSAKERGRQAKCLANLRQLSMAFQRYVDDYDGRMPSLSSTTLGHPPDWCGSPWVGLQVRPETGQLWPYTKNREIYVCPSDNNTPAGTRGTSFYIPNFALSYSVNYVLHLQKLDPATAGRASKVLLMIHEGRQPPQGNINDGYFAWGNNWDFPSHIHYDGTTASYCDGHAKWLSYKELEREWTSGEWLRNDQLGQH